MSDVLNEPIRIQPADVRALLDMIAGTDVEELEVEYGGARISIGRKPSGEQMLFTEPPLDSGAEAVALSANASGSTGEPASGQITVTASIVGLFFRGREPGAEPLALEGDPVTAGQVLAIIESLRVPHAVESPGAGLLEQVLVHDGHPVEYGQPIMVIRSEV